MPEIEVETNYDNDSDNMKKMKIMKKELFLLQTIIIIIMLIRIGMSSKKYQLTNNIPTIVDQIENVYELIELNESNENNFDPIITNDCGNENDPVLVTIDGIEIEKSDVELL